MSGPESLNPRQATQGNAPLPLCNRRKEEAWPCGCSSSKAQARRYGSTPGCPQPLVAIEVVLDARDPSRVEVVEHGTPLLRDR
jgi:hypothetical protein